MTTYSYTISGDFPSGINNGQLAHEIATDTIITTILVTVEVDGNNVYIIFSASLSTPELNELNLLISNHVPTTVVKGIYNVHANFVEQDSAYKTFASRIYPLNTNIQLYSFIFPGTYYGFGISKVNLLYAGTYSLDPNYSFIFKINDYTNKNLIYSTTITDTSNLIVEYDVMSGFTNIPVDKSYFEVQIQILAGDEIRIYSFGLNY